VSFAFLFLYIDISCSPSIEAILLRSMLYAHCIGVCRANFQKFSSRLKATGAQNTAVLTQNSSSCQRIQGVTARYFEKHSNLDFSPWTKMQSYQLVVTMTDLTMTDFYLQISHFSVDQLNLSISILFTASDSMFKACIK
jgi:hypothetical protein